MSVRPWRLAHRGTVSASGVAISLRDDPADAVRRAMSAWSPGSEVLDLGDTWAVLWSAARMTRADALPGAALLTLRRGDGASLRSAIPLQPKEIDAVLAGPGRAGDVVLAGAGAAAVHNAAGAQRVDLAACIDLGALDLATEVTPLGDPPPRVRALDGPAASPWFSKVTGGALAEALNAAATEAAKGEAPASAPWWMRALSWLGAVFAIASKSKRGPDLPAPDASEADGDDGARAAAASLAQTPRASWWERLQVGVAKSLWGARLEKFLGDRQARYLNDVVEMFEEGRLSEALKRAIPLGSSDPDGAEKPLSWSIPRPRDALDIRLATSTTQTAASPPDLHEKLKALYRSAVARLEAEGRAEEAAFVLAELLREPEAAVSLLEANGRFEAAASLADRARMPPVARVRQWMRAGDRVRAFALARRYRCYEGAATLLDAVDAELAAWLRAEHARHLARTGDLGSAVRAGERVPAMRDEVLRWMDELIARGGPEAARMLPGRVLADESAFGDVTARVLALCASRDARAERVALAKALDETARQRSSAALTALARPLLRVLLRDAAQSGDGSESALVTQLAQRAGADMVADLPRWPSFARERLDAAMASPNGPPRAQLTVDLSERGLRGVEDCAALPDGSVLLAMGESGAELWSRAGKRLHRFDEPCARLVISTHGDRALALAPRGSHHRVAVLDLAARRSWWWADLRLDAWADDFDGDAWLVSQEGQVMELDATDLSEGAPTPLRVLAEAPAAQGVTARALALQRAPAALTALGWLRERGDVHTTLQVWSPETGSRVHSRSLDTLTEAVKLPEVFAVDASAERVLRIEGAEGAHRPLTVISRTLRESWLLDEGTFALAARDGRICALARTDEGVSATLYNPRNTPCLRVLLLGASHAVARLQGGALLLADDLGRVRRVDLAYGATTLELRV